MNAVADFLIAVLIDFKTEGPVAQIGFVALVLGAVFGVAIWFVRRVNKRVDVLVGTERDLKARLDKQLGIIEGLRKERDANADLLDQLDPDRFRKTLATARRTSLSAAEAEAETYVDWHAPALKDAYGVLLQARLAQVEYGESALLAARRHAMGAIAADPHDLDAQASLKTVDALLDAEARTPETEAAKTERAERDALLGEIEAAPEDPDVLRRVAAKFFERGRYRLAEAVAERALEAAAAAGRNPDGEFGLRVRFRMIESAIFGGRHMRAEQVLDPALEAAKRTQGPDAAVTLSLRSVQGSLALSQGRAAEAEAALRALLPDYERAQGESHPGTLATRHELARALLNQGRAAEAEAAWRALLPDLERVKGASHPDTLTTRASIARAQLDQGRAAEAEAAWRALLPDEERVKGASHPHTLTTRALLVAARARLGDVTGAREAAAGLPEDLGAVFGEGNPRIGRVLLPLGELAAAEGDREGAARRFEAAEALYAGRLAPEAFEHRDLAEARARWLPDDAAAPPAAAS